MAISPNSDITAAQDRVAAAKAALYNATRAVIRATTFEELAAIGKNAAFGPGALGFLSDTLDSAASDTQSGNVDWIIPDLSPLMNCYQLITETSAEVPKRTIWRKYLWHDAHGKGQPELFESVR